MNVEKMIEELSGKILDLNEDANRINAEIEMLERAVQILREIGK